MSRVKWTGWYSPCMYSPISPIKNSPILSFLKKLSHLFHLKKNSPITLFFVHHFPTHYSSPPFQKTQLKKKPLTRSLTLKHTSIKWHMYTSKFVRVGENRVKADINMYSKLFKRYKKEIFIGKHFCHPLIYYFRTWIGYKKYLRYLHIWQKYFPPVHNVQLCLMWKSTVGTQFQCSFSFYTFPKMLFVDFCIHNFCFLLHICYESGPDILLGVGPPTLRVIALPQFAIARSFVNRRL